MLAGWSLSRVLSLCEHDLEKGGFLSVSLLSLWPPFDRSRGAVSSPFSIPPRWHITGHIESEDWGEQYSKIRKALGADTPVRRRITSLTYVLTTTDRTLSRSLSVFSTAGHGRSHDTHMHQPHHANQSNQSIDRINQSPHHYRATSSTRLPAGPTSAGSGSSSPAGYARTHEDQCTNACDASACLSVFLTVSLSACLPVNLSVSLPVSLSICLSVCDE